MSSLNENKLLFNVEQRLRNAEARTPHLERALDESVGGYFVECACGDPICGGNCER